jgi:hypothetical protein
MLTHELTIIDGLGGALNYASQIMDEARYSMA